MTNLALVVLAVLLVFLNGFFVAAEFAIVKLRKTQAVELARSRGLLGRVVKSVRMNLDAYLSACQLGITLSSLALGWIGEPAFAHLLEPLLHAVGVGSPEVIHGISFAVAFTVISFLHIVLGELAPKSVAIRKPAAVALLTATPLFLFYWVMYPFIWVLNGCANSLLRTMGVDLAHEGDEVHSAEEIKSVLLASHRHGELGHEVEILARALEFPKLAVGDLMHPAHQMVVVDAAAPIQDSLALITHHRFSRYPVGVGGRHQLIGVLLVKDLFAALQKRPDLVDIREVMRELPMTPRHTSAMKMLRRFRRGYPNLVVITGSAGEAVGFLTLDHLLEALLGRIQDEFHRPHNDWKPLLDGSFEGDGQFTIYMLEKLVGRYIEADDVSSVGGLVMHELGRIPIAGDRAEFQGFAVEVVRMRGARITRVLVRLQPVGSDSRH